MQIHLVLQKKNGEGRFTFVGKSFEVPQQPQMFPPLKSALKKSEAAILSLDKFKWIADFDNMQQARARNVIP